MSAIIGVIGGSGLTRLEGLRINKREVMHTPYGEPSGAFTRGSLNGQEIIFLPRHGSSHQIPPHEVNYCANLWALKELGVQDVIAFNAVGGIHKDLGPETIVIPDQIIDYTYSRAHTYFTEASGKVVHIDFTHPYTPSLRKVLIAGAASVGVKVVDGGVYAATQGPRLETAGEIDRLERDGCDIVGMTAMPEAALAREVDLDYASVCMVANYAAGRGDSIITMEQINKSLKNAMQSGMKLLEGIVT